MLAAVFNYPGASSEKVDNWIHPVLGFCQAGVSKGQKHKENYKFCRLWLKWLSMKSKMSGEKVTW